MIQCRLTHPEEIQQHQMQIVNHKKLLHILLSKCQSLPIFDQILFTFFFRFVRDSSKFWYKPSITRDEAITLLRNAQPGTFIVRDSTSFANAYGLVIKVSHPPSGAQKGPGGDELVRHFLIEPTTRGVRLKGCANEPVFSSLSALVYQHSITPLALSCRLIIPDRVSFYSLFFFVLKLMASFCRIFKRLNIIHQHKNNF